ncbi:hypothetical protein EOD41_20055 [Mucilaginibacter limnophilus]|uniref:Uncharacterized protein n=1 Tax=Mucilaginibacter limnophilus TaxID=1932778 RepID=A0A437MFV7_9SPHI|nr:hypothetical protein [Mucilaginibacter limnophilus]RVT96524.1 hypothetical protein EOD41_20055 [Mucilaginibacter limnophilus]
METKYINEPVSTPARNQSGSFWYEMKPFVKFGWKAMGLIAGALIAIVKSIPKPLVDKADNTYPLKK